MSFLWKETNGMQGPTPLPNKKLLLSILDRLQKKDTFGAFKKPIDPKELPDYHDTIEQPMDFRTIRKKLNNGEYANFEQFESDVFLISANAMCYNARKTVYYRQAQAIRVLAEKEFKNLRGDNGAHKSKMEQKYLGNNTVNRKAMVADSSANIAGNGRRLASLRPNMGWKGKDKLSDADAQRYPCPGTGEDENISFSSDELGMETSEDDSDSDPRYGKVSISRRRSYVKDKHRSTNYELPMSDFEIGTMKQQQLQLQQPLDYARSLARFAANLGPVGWDAAASRIRQVLPPATEFGRGWVAAAAAASPPEPASSASSATTNAGAVQMQDVVSPERSAVETINGFDAARLRDFLRFRSSSSSSDNADLQF